MSYSEIRELIAEKGHAAALEQLVKAFYVSKQKLKEAEDAYNAAKADAAFDSSSISHYMLAASRDGLGESIPEGHVIAHVMEDRVVVIRTEGEKFTLSNWPKLPEPPQA